MNHRLSDRARRWVNAINLLWAGRQARGGLEYLFTDPDDAAYAADTRALAAFDARQRAATPADCRTCPPEAPLTIQSEAYYLGRDTSDGESIRQVAVWLRAYDYEAWSDTSEGKLQRIALALITMRDAIERGERVPG